MIDSFSWALGTYFTSRNTMFFIDEDAFLVENAVWKVANISIG